jgi:hypothetical protein
LEMVGRGVVSWTVCLGWPWTMFLPISASQVAGITGMSYWPPAFLCVRDVRSCLVKSVGFVLTLICRQHWCFHLSPPSMGHSRAFLGKVARKKINVWV